MTFQTIIFEKRDHIGYITFNRPDVFNAVNRQLMSELRQLLAEISQDSEIRVVIITGAGKAFMSGADIVEISKMNPIEIGEWNHRLTENWSPIERLKQP